MKKETSPHCAKQQHLNSASSCEEERKQMLQKGVSSALGYFAQGSQDCARLQCSSSTTEMQ